MEKNIGSTLKSFVSELAVYAGLVTAYFFLVLRLLGGWLEHIFEHNRDLYAYLALLLIIGQGLLLEVLTRVLLYWFSPRNRR